MSNGDLELEAIEVARASATGPGGDSNVHRDRRDPEPHKPLAAEVGPDGRVVCVGCGALKPLRQMDVVGLGHRCASCTGHAEVAALTGSNDLAHNLTSAEREGMHVAAAKLIPGSIVMALIGAMLIPFWPSDIGRLSGIPYLMVIGGIVGAFGAIGTMRYARGRGGG